MSPGAGAGGATAEVGGTNVGPGTGTGATGGGATGAMVAEFCRVCGRLNSRVGFEQR